MREVSVISQSGKYKIFEKGVKKAVQAALAFLKKDGVSVTVYLISNKEMGRLNQRFRKRKGTTNILAFPEPKDFPHPESRLRPLGEIYLAPDFAAKKGENLKRLVLHGLLHLLGFSHSRKSDRIRMEKMERKLCPSSSLV